MKRTYLTLIILMLVIGFAAVSTNLVISGKINIGFNEDEFNIYFSYASLDDVQKDELISKDKQTITFTATDSNLLEFDITNESSQYDAVVSVTCTPESNENYRIESNVIDRKVEAKELVTGKVNVEMKEGSANLEVTCTLEVVAISRVEKNTEEVKKRCDFDLGTEWKFDYKGSEQSFEVPCDAIYKVELWGAQGGNGFDDNTSNVLSGGLGSYVSGEIKLFNFQKFYIYVGSKGGNAINYTGGSAGFNGGGAGGNSSTSSSDHETGGGGGGATDIRLINGTWNNFESLKSRIMVASGGGGGAYRLIDQNGGGLINGGLFKFGYGNTSAPNTASTGGGGGGGYYGGICGITEYVKNSTVGYTGRGGTSFISGHQGCDAIQETSTSSSIQHTGQPNHYSGLIFSNTVMIDGAGYNWTDKKGDYVGMPTHDGKSKMAGNSGNGYAKITLVMATT